MKSSRWRVMCSKSFGDSRKGRRPLPSMATLRLRGAGWMRLVCHRHAGRHAGDTGSDGVGNARAEILS